MNQFNGRVVLVIGVLLAACCCLSAAGFLLVLRSFPEASSLSSALVDKTIIATLVSQDAANPSETPVSILNTTPSASDSRPPSTQPPVLPPSETVPSATPSQSSAGSPRDPYVVIVPTPTAPNLRYPIGFDSSLKIVTYPVSGVTERELSNSLSANALPDPHEQNNRYYARTDWYLSAHWNWMPSSKGCEVSSGDVSLAMTMTLPALATPNSISPSVLDRWDTFVDNTVLHESGHVKLDLAGARRYQQELGTFSPAADCNSLKGELRALFDDNYSAIDKANVDYDAQTQHGMDQGAVYPPR